jgi:hypothetical protein
MAPTVASLEGGAIASRVSQFAAAAALFFPLHIVAGGTNFSAQHKQSDGVLREVRARIANFYAAIGRHEIIYTRPAGRRSAEQVP